MLNSFILKFNLLLPKRILSDPLIYNNFSHIYIFIMIKLNINPLDNENLQESLEKDKIMRYYTRKQR